MNKTMGALLCAAGMVMFLLVSPLFAAEKVFQESGYGFVMNYPQDWEYTKRAGHMIIFTKKGGADANVPVVGVQNLLSTKVKGGKHEDVGAVLADFENQLKITKYARVYPAEPFVYGKKGLKITGRQFVADYVFRDKNYKQLVVVIPRKDGEIFHAWVYSAPEDLYEKYLPSAKAMLDSLTMTDQ